MATGDGLAQANVGDVVPGEEQQLACCVFDAADRGLYAAKGAGRDRLVVAND